jgi:hypothetical protein
MPKKLYKQVDVMLIFKQLSCNWIAQEGKRKEQNVLEKLIACFPSTTIWIIQFKVEI